MLEAHNRIFKTEWKTSSTHSKPYANWALPGAACYDGKNSVNEYVVTMGSTDTPDWVFPLHRRPSDDEQGLACANDLDG